MECVKGAWARACTGDESTGKNGVEESAARVAGNVDGESSARISISDSDSEMEAQGELARRISEAATAESALPAAPIAATVADA